MKLGRYSNLRPTDIIGHDQIPAHWDVRKVARAFDLIGSGTTPNTNLGDYYDGDINWVTTAELREAVIEDTQKKVTERALAEHSALRMYSAGSVAIAMYGATIGRLGILGAPATVNQACCVFDRSSVLENRYFYYWLWSYRPVLLSLSSGGGQPNLSQDDLRSVRAPIPPLSEQRSIVDFLDRETARIDALIEKKRRLLELLEEKRLAVITHAVTKGLDPSVPMKDIGIDWLGQIPAHWEVKRVKFATSFITSGSRGWAEYYSEDGALFLQSGNLGTQMELNFSVEQRVSPPAGAEGRRTAVAQGDVLVCITGARTGAVAHVSDDLGEAYINQHVALLRPLANLIDPRFLAYSLWSNCGREQLWLSSYGMKEGLGLQHVLAVQIASPTVTEQKAIVAHLDQDARRLGEIARKVGDAINRLIEYRSALITNVVTGKIDVREEAAKEAAA